ncbi:MAG: hypothetical protein LBR96_01505 [Treponema sp.]|nr:hypothetical protein [Treponema sp.]
MGRLLSITVFVFCLPILIHAQVQEVLRGAVRIDVEPPSPLYMDEEIPPRPDTLRRRALEESALYYGAMIYGWSFRYEIGERARGIAEEIELEKLGSIVWGDPALRPTDARLLGSQFLLETDYYLNEVQLRRRAAWKSGTVKSIQGYGTGPLGGPESEEGWLALKEEALKDAARAALRGFLRGQERNRPKTVNGFICLAAFPRYFTDSGYLKASGRFLADITEVRPFAAW